MNKTINVGVIGQGMTEEDLMTLAKNSSDHFYFRKILPGSKLASGISETQYPTAEIVDDARAIVDDDAIELVFISAAANDSPVVEEALQAGKHVRIV